MVLQFGAGNFLRGFADLFIDELNRTEGDHPGEIVVVQSTGKERADMINASGGKYHVAIQGYQDGEVVEKTVEVNSIREALHAGTEWEKILEVAVNPDLKMILSNTTESGLALDSADSNFSTTSAPHSFPGKLLAVLKHRFDNKLPGSWIVPCELVESNGDRLRELVMEQARLWRFDDKLLNWITSECRWVNTLVDRIVPGRPNDHPLLSLDPLLISAEPFAFWAVETNDEDFPLAKHPAVVLSDDISPYTLMKVRILNGAHTAMVCKANGTDIETVREFVENQETGRWLEELLFEEIVPVLEGRCENPLGFARDTLDRFRNPFLDHKLSSIALNHDDKVKVRLLPTIREYVEKFGREPSRMAQLVG